MTVLLWFLIAVAAGLVGYDLLSRVFLRRGRRRPNPRSDRRTFAECASVLNDVSELLERAEQVSARISSEVDAKLAALRAVTRDADEALARATAARARRTESQPDSCDADLPHALTEHRRKPHVELDRAAVAAAAVPSTPPRLARAYDLRDGGKDAIAIAEELSVPLGEVELMLSLRNLTTRSADRES
jgi:hypothetical protein